MIDVVVQGPFHPYTPQVINQFLEQEWTRKVIVSTWYGEPVDLSQLSGPVELVYNDDVPNPGITNRNRQIKSSVEGIKQIETVVGIKARSDQLLLDLKGMKEFYDEHQSGHALFVLGLYRAYPFHPRDHFFMGPTENLFSLFSVPQDDYSGPPEYTHCLRSEAWIGSYYYGLFSQRAKKMREDYMTYLVDGAPRIQEALDLDNEMKHELFRSFPRINMAWPKYGLSAYHYDLGQKMSEYWHEDTIR